MANTYATVELARDYASARGLSLPESDDDVQRLLVLANDYLQSLESRYKGERTNADTAWPRSGVIMHGIELDADIIPSLVINAECQLAVDAGTNELQPNSSGFAVSSESVDVISVSYAVPTGAAPASTTFTKAMAMLEPVLNPARLRTIRV